MKPTTLITNSDVRVTYKMMADVGLAKRNAIRGILLGVPFILDEEISHITWIEPEYLTEEDFDAIEKYFLQIQNADI